MTDPFRHFAVYVAEGGLREVEQQFAADLHYTGADVPHGLYYVQRNFDLDLQGLRHVIAQLERLVELREPMSTAVNTTPLNEQRTRWLVWSHWQLTQGGPVSK